VSSLGHVEPSIMPACKLLRHQRRALSCRPYNGPKGPSIHVPEMYPMFADVVRQARRLICAGAFQNWTAGASWP